MNPSGVCLDPLTPYSRIQTAGFAELSLSPDTDGGDTVMMRSPSGTSIATVDTQSTTLRGFKLGLKLCGIPFSVLEMLTGTVPLDNETPGTVAAAAWRNGYDPQCLNPVMLELWSKNVSAATDCDVPGAPAAGKWIHWLVPFTFDWKLGGNISFANNVLEIELEGYGRQNPAFFPSWPGELFPSYEPGAGDPDGWPTGAPSPTLPAGIVADSWTVAEAEAIRISGPLAWKVVDDLPDPLDDCEYVGAPCEPSSFTADFCGPEGDALPAPWDALPAVEGMTTPALLGGDCTVPMSATETPPVLVGSVPVEADCCGGACRQARVEFGDPSGDFAGIFGATLIFDNGCVLAAFVYVTAPGSAQVGVVGFTPGSFDVFTPAWRATPDPFAASMAGGSISISWCGGGSVNVEFAQGETANRWTVSGFDLLTGGSVLTDAGFALATPAEPLIPSAAMTGFESSCLPLPSGDPLVAERYCGDDPFVADFCGPAAPLASPWYLPEGFEAMSFVLAETDGACAVSPIPLTPQVAGFPIRSVVGDCCSIGHTARISGPISVVVDGPSSYWSTPQVMFRMEDGFYLISALFALFSGGVYFVNLSAAIVSSDLSTQIAGAVVAQVVSESDFLAADYSFEVSWDEVDLGWRCEFGSVTMERRVTSAGGFVGSTTTDLVGFVINSFGITNSMSTFEAVCGAIEAESAVAFTPIP